MPESTDEIARLAGNLKSSGRHAELVIGYAFQFYCLVRKDSVSGTVRAETLTEALSKAVVLLEAL